MRYPRILIVAMTRINAADNFNNGLLLRNLFSNWPRQNLAQIYSGGDNGDEGFFKHYYEIGPRDRWLGSLFFKIKNKTYNGVIASNNLGHKTKRSCLVKLCIDAGERFLFDTGLYEIIFRPRISREMEKWVREFNPNIIFAQGYNLAFTWLPIMLEKRFNIPIIYYPTDDWPSDLYRPDKRYGIKALTHSIVRKSVDNLVRLSKVRIAFNPLMEKEYKFRYGVDFVVLMHGDDKERFDISPSIRLFSEDVRWIVSTGVFDGHRLPLLKDLDESCRILNNKGINTMATIFPVNYQEMKHLSFDFINLHPCPDHEELPSYLKGADVLFLPERFDMAARDIKLSVSSKAHLFMFANRPIVVYSDISTGIAKYALMEGWGEVVGRRDPFLLASAIESLLFDKFKSETLISNAQKTVSKYHNLQNIRSIFWGLITKSCWENGCKNV